MTEQQRQVLAVLQLTEGVTVEQVAHAAGVPWKTAFRRLGLLERDGYAAKHGRAGWQATRRGMSVACATSPLRTDRQRQPRSSMPRAKTFSEKYPDPDGERYGELFLIVRVMRCDLCKRGYSGPGHRMDGSQDLRRGVQGGHTAHHVHRYDRQGMIPVDGAAHDLVAGLGSAETQRAFKTWLLAEGVTLDNVGMEYVAVAEAVRAGERKLTDRDLAW